MTPKTNKVIKNILNKLLCYFSVICTGALGCFTALSLRKLIVATLLSITMKPEVWRVVDLLSIVIIGLVWFSVTIFSLYFYEEGVEKDWLLRNIFIVLAPHLFIFSISQFLVFYINNVRGSVQDYFAIIIEFFLGLIMVVVVKKKKWR